MLALLVAVGLTAPPATGAVPTTAVVTGRVVGDVEGAPAVPGVAVSAQDPRTGAVVARATTGATGGYRLDRLPPGTWTLCFDASAVAVRGAPAGWYSRCAPTVPTTATTIAVHAGQMVRGADALLDPATVVTGKVTDPSGNPVAGAGISADERLPDAVTGRDGRYRAVRPWRDLGFPLTFHGLGGRSPLSSVGFVDLDYTDAEGHIIFSPAAGQVLTVDTVMRPAASAAGRITDLTGHGLLGALVTLEGNDYSRPVATDADGRFRVDGLDPALAHAMVVDARAASGGTSSTGYLSRCYRKAKVQFVDGRVDCRGGPHYPFDTFALIAGGVAGTAFPLSPAGSLSGTVNDSAGRPLAGMTVQLRRVLHPNEQFWLVPPPVTSDRLGHWRVDGIETDSYTVCATGAQVDPAANPDPDGYQDTCAAATTPVTSGQASTTAALVVTDRGGIDVHVLGRDGAPVQFVTVSYTDASWHGTGGWPVDASGHHRFGQVAQGAGYSVCAFGPDAQRGDAACTGDVRVGPGTTSVTLTLAPRGSLSGRITQTTTSATPVPDTTVFVTGITGRGTWTAQTDAAGHYAVANLPAGSYRVCAADPAGGIRCLGDRTQTQPVLAVQVASGADTPGVDVHFPPWPTGVGRVQLNAAERGHPRAA